ncbi:hypothetical protein DFP72DRAFT_303577 [Ephemerocybe angulata]|uniref:EGF-like domain-containing protein n=1 Tax=Ephemerocybe angulata TaxID=980116 RepID=A0A8H6I0U7_9AGAR|nr:hypothetical protein DFP72DRAFT_303577 [Tulosesus angulatus]
MHFPVHLLALFIPFLLPTSLISVNAQTCENYGTANAGQCACPTGFGGPTCALPGCHSTIFDGAQRQFASTSGTGSAALANLTAAGCACEAGWGGTGCNVCQSSSACQTAFAAAKGSSASPDISSAGAVQNGTMVCNTEPRVWAAGQMSCQVINPTLQAIFSGQSTLNIERTLDPGLSPLPGSTSFGAKSSVSAQLFYDGVEQFYCHADSCAQTLASNSTKWECQNLQCTCRPGTTFCGGAPASDLTGAINGLSGALGIDCAAIDAGTGKAPCHFVQSTLQSLFGSAGLGLDGCAFGECVRQSVIDAGGGAAADPAQTVESSKLSGGVIAGLVVVGVLVLLALALLLVGLLRQRAARRDGNRDLDKAHVGVEWKGLSYMVPSARNFFTRQAQGSSEDKTILDNITGRVNSRQMMAILGPSGAGKTTLVEILAGKNKVGVTTGSVSFPSQSGKTVESALRPSPAQQPNNNQHHRATPGLALPLPHCLLPRLPDAENLLTPPATSPASPQPT